MTTKEKLKLDLDFFLKTLEEGINKEGKSYPPHPFPYFNSSKDDLMDYINQTWKNLIFDDRIEIAKLDFLYYINGIIKKILDPLDSHTKFAQKSRVRPITVKIFDNIPYVTDSVDEFKDYKFCKISKINGIPIKILIEEIKNVTVYSTDGYLRLTIEEYLQDCRCLLTLPSINSSSNVISYELDDDPSKIISWDVYKETNLSNSSKKENCSLSINNEVITFIYDSCDRNKCDEVKKITEEIKHALEFGCTTLIIDLRNNMGGDSSVIKPLIEMLQNYQKENGKITLITLTNYKIFSSGRWAIIDLQNLGSKFIGNYDIGTSASSFGYNDTWSTLPNSGLIFSYSRVYWYHDHQSNKIKRIDLKELSESDYLSFKAVTTLDLFHPDIIVEETLDDCKNGTDPIMEEAILHCSKKEKIK